MTISELEIERAGHEASIKELNKQIDHCKLSEKMKQSYELGHGWPRIAQSLGLKEKLGYELYAKLYYEIAVLVDGIASLVPSYAEVAKECPKCAKVREIVAP